MTWIRVRIRVCQQKMKTPARLRTGPGKSTTANVCGDFLKEKWGREVLMANYTDCGEET